MPIICFYGYEVRLSSKLALTSYTAGASLSHQGHTAQVQPCLSQCVSQDAVVHSGVSQGDWGRTKVLDFLSLAMLREAILFVTLLFRP